MDDALAALKTNTAQWAMLKTIAHHPGSSARHLATATFQTEQSVGALATKMAARGLITRTPGPGRAISLQLTRAGQALLDRCTPVVEDALDRAFARLTQADRAALCDLLELASGEDTPRHDRATTRTRHHPLVV